MSVDIGELSSEQLFELARKKRQQEEQRAEAREAAQRHLKRQRAQLVAEHAKALEAVDYQIRELHGRRAQLVIRHKAAVDTVDKQIADLCAEAREDVPTAGSTEAPRIAAKPVKDTAETVQAAILELMQGRTYLSESLLKERLRGKGLDVTHLRQLLEQLKRTGKIVDRGAGNYALSKKK